MYVLCWEYKKITGIYSMKTLMSLYGIDEIKAL